MSTRVHVRIDAKRHTRARAARPRQPIDPLQLARRFRVDRVDADRDSLIELRLRLADAGEHEVCWIETRPERHVELAA